MREEEAQKNEKLGGLAKLVAMDSMMEDAGGDIAGAAGGKEAYTGEREEEADDEDMETDREDGGVALATGQ